VSFIPEMVFYPNLYTDLPLRHSAIIKDDGGRMKDEIKPLFILSLSRAAWENALSFFISQVRL